MTNEVAQTILSQLGGGRFVMMTGAKHLMSTSTQRGGLRFLMPATPHFVKNRIRVMEIVLTEADLYDLRCFVKHAGAPLGFKEIAGEQGVYAENLAQAFTSLTGLDTNLGAIRRASA